MPKVSRAHGTRRTVRTRSRFIIAMLLVSLGLTAALAWQALDAAQSHRAVVQAVLRDYAGLAADEYVRRTANHVGYRGYYPLISALTEWAESHPGLPEREELESRLDERSQRALELPLAFFRISLDDDSTTLYGAGNPAAGERLRGRFAGIENESDAPARGLAVIHDTVGEEPRCIVYAAPAGEPATRIGFEVRPSALGAWFRETFETAPLLPASLTGGDEANDWITLTVYDAAGESLFSSGGEFSYYLMAYREFGEAYSGVLAGSRVAAAVDPRAAPQLIIGGLPRSRLPLLLGLLALNAGLLVAAILQLRRERALSRLRSDFVSRVSHELRTPLTQIRMFAETLLLDRVRSDAERRRSLEIIDKESRRLTHLVENILQFSRGERGTIRLVRRPHELAGFIRELVEEFEPLAGDGGVRLVTRLERVDVALDGDAMRQVMLNLLDNAVKYGPPEQEISVDTIRTDGVVRIRVEDEGPGVPPGERERIWERFHRLQRDDLATAGTGIGLAVVRELVTLHGGRVWVEGGDRGGARFVVELPLQPPVPAADARQVGSGGEVA